MNPAQRKNAALTRATVCFLLFAFFSISVPQQASAQFVPVHDHPAFIEQVRDNTVDQNKEFSMDTIAWMAANIMLSQMVRSVTEWVESGFDGSPAFVSNPGRFLRDIGDEVGGEFIYQIAPILCEPFSLDIQFQLSLDLQYRTDRSIPNCTISDAVDNVEGFVNGTFSEADGWRGWFAITQNRQNNPHDLYLSASNEMDIRISGARELELFELDWGDGFLSSKDDEGNIKTPGSTINTALDNALSNGQNKLHAADEFNELIGAVLSQVLTRALSETGLAGSASASRSGFDPSDLINDLEEQRAERDNRLEDVVDTPEGDVTLDGQSFTGDLSGGVVELRVNDEEQAIVSDITLTNSPVYHPLGPDSRSAIEVPSGRIFVEDIAFYADGHEDEIINGSNVEVRNPEFGVFGEEEDNWTRVTVEEVEGASLVGSHNISGAQLFGAEVTNATVTGDDDLTSENLTGSHVQSGEAALGATVSGGTLIKRGTGDDPERELQKDRIRGGEGVITDIENIYLIGGEVAIDGETYKIIDPESFDCTPGNPCDPADTYARNIATSGDFVMIDGVEKRAGELRIDDNRNRWFIREYSWNEVGTIEVDGGVRSMTIDSVEGEEE